MEQAGSGMIDYLEELLDALEEPEEDRAVLEVREMFTPVIGGAVAADGRENAPAGSGRNGLAEPERRISRPGDLPARVLERLGPVGPEDKPERTLTWSEDGGTAGVWKDMGGLEGGHSAVSGSILAALGRQADVGGSAAALERRLAAGLALQGTVARPVGGFAAEEQAGGGLELEELDRRVERDARRYDGGMFLY